MDELLSSLLLALIQTATEFLPISSSGHLAIASNIISKPDLFLITALHLASLFAVLIYTRRELRDILTLKTESRKLILFLVVATIPAALAGLLLKPLVEELLTSTVVIGISFLFTGCVLTATRFVRRGDSAEDLNAKNSLMIGLFQVLALLPGISRSGMTISSGMILGVPREKAAKFSFLLFIPLSCGAFVLETGNFYISLPLVVSFVVCMVLSLLFLSVLFRLIRNNRFYLFGIYCFVAGIVTLATTL